MHSAGWAFAWEFWSRYRILSVLAVAHLVGLVLLVNIFPAGTFNPEGVASGTMPIWGILLIILAGTHGEKADILARESPYSARLFTLPVRTTALVAWPMAVAGLAMALLWLILGTWVLRPGGANVPLLWPAVFLAALMVWAQALLWHPFPLPALRIFVAVPILGGMVFGAAACHTFKVWPALLATVSAVLIPAAYFVGVAGLSRARRGDVPVWHWPIFHDRVVGSNARAPFASAAAALVWLDWRRNAYVLPFLLSLLLVPVLLATLYFGGGNTPHLIAALLVGTMILVPLLMAAAAGASLGNTHPWATESYAMPSFTAVRPVTSGLIIAVKIRVALRIFLVGWVFAVVMNLAVVPFSDAGATLSGWVLPFVEREGVRGWATLLAGALGLALLNLKAIIDQLFIGLSGRLWINVVLGITLSVAAIAIVAACVPLIDDPEWKQRIIAALPWIIAMATALKLAASALVTHLLLRRDLVAPRTLARIAAVWLVVAVVLVALAVWLVPPEICSPPIAGCAAILLGLPMVRLGLAPLALEWNRHR